MDKLAIAEIRAQPEWTRGGVREADAWRHVEETAKERWELKVRRPIDLGLVKVRKDAIA